MNKNTDRVEPYDSAHNQEGVQPQNVMTSVLFFFSVSSIHRVSVVRSQCRVSTEARDTGLTAFYIASSDSRLAKMTSLLLYTLTRGDWRRGDAGQVDVGAVVVVTS